MEIKESFFKGVNRAVKRTEFNDPDFFWSTQNARVLQDGRIGEVVRINGYTQVNTQLNDVLTLYDMVSFRDHFIAFYYDGIVYRVKVFNSNGTLDSSFSYSETITPEWGQLKQYNNTVFIAPHNKIIYFKDNTFFLKDFISKNVKIDSSSLDDTSATAASYGVTINNTIAAYGGRKARGIIKVLRNTLPDGVSDTFQVHIGADISDNIVINNQSTILLRYGIAFAINNSAAFTGKWTAEVSGEDVVIFANAVGVASNDVEISIENSTYLKSENITEGFFLGDGAWTFDSRTEQTRDGITLIGGGGAGGTTDANITSMLITNTFGGLDSNTVVGSITVSLRDAIVTRDITINSTDTTTNIATKIETILNSSDDVTEDYTITRTTNTVTITAKEKGKKYNTDVVITLNDAGNLEIELPDNFYSITSTDGTDANTTGTLTPNTNYWYTARLKYIDGHITTTCSPIHANSKANNFVVVTFDVDITDLDDNLPALQVFRKEEGGEFFLIKEVNLDVETIVANQYVFTDRGFSNIQPLNERFHVWTKEHRTQEVVDNKFIKANIDLFSEQYTAAPANFTFTAPENTETQDVAPVNSKIDLYIRPQFTDGTLGYFTDVGSLDITQANRKLTVQQLNVLSGDEKTISDLRFYGKYQPFGEEQNLKFNTVEVQTPNLSGIANPQYYPGKTKVFYGFKEVLVASSSIANWAFIGVNGWATNDSSPYRFIGAVSPNNTNRGSIKYNANDELEVNVHGNVKTYIPVATWTDTALAITTTYTLYRLEEFKALEEAVSTGALKIRLNRTNRGSLSKVVSDDELTELTVNVTALEDFTYNDDEYTLEKGTNIGLLDRYFPGYFSNQMTQLVPNRDSRIYLVLEDSKLDEIDNNKINRYEYLGEENERIGEPDLSIRKTGSIAFDIINFNKTTDAVIDLTNTTAVKTENGDFDRINNTEAQYSLINKELSKDTTVIYLGKKDNELSTVDLETTGFYYKLRSNLVYSKLAPYNIYEALVLESDFNFNDTKFRNQIIWSDNLLTANYFSGGRNFDISNFYNLPSENGEILDIVSLGGNIFAFCERGVAQLFVGESLTQQKSGQVFIDSSSFITKHVWILENLSDIKLDSIQKIDNTIYFTDGITVYKVGSNGLDDISKGVIVLDETVDYIGTLDVFYDEYRLSNPSTGETFAYNTKYQLWSGPYTYVAERSVWVNSTTYSYINGLMQEDTGNTFAGTSFSTILQSVGNDTEIGGIDKRFRKFYLGVDGAFTFRYGKDFNVMQALSSANIIEKNGYYNVGINPDNSNSKKIYWDIETTDATFSLKGFHSGFQISRRR